VKPLQGRRIVVTRPSGQSEGLAALVREAGGEALSIPAIEIRPLEDTAPFLELAARLASFDLAIFVSRNAVEGALDLIAKSGLAWPAKLRVATVGQGSRSALQARGFARVIAPSAQSDSEALLALPELARVRGWRVVIFRGDAGRALLGAELERRGAEVVYAACYRRVRPSSEGLARAWAAGVDAVTVSSGEGLANFLGMLGPQAVARLGRLPVFVPHPRVAEEARRSGVENAVLGGPGNAEMAAALVAYFGAAR